MRMTIQQLSIFLAVCREMNYTRAAAEVYMSRQAVRQNIAELEKELCGPLFDNCRNRLQLTEKGKLLLTHAAPVVEQFQALQQTMNADIRAQHPLRLGISVALVPDYLPTLAGHLQDFRTNYPGVLLEEHEVQNDEAVPALAAGLLDACLVMDLCGQREGTERTVLTSHPVGVLMKNTHPLFRRTELEVSDLEGCTLFVPGLGEEFRPLFDAASELQRKQGFEVLPSFYQVLFHIMDHNGIALNRVAEGDDSKRSLVRTIPLHGLPPLCSSMITREEDVPAPLLLLRGWLMTKLREEFSR